MNMPVASIQWSHASPNRREPHIWLVDRRRRKRTHTHGIYSTCVACLTRTISLLTDDKQDIRPKPMSWGCRLVACATTVCKSLQWEHHSACLKVVGIPDNSVLVLPEWIPRSVGFWVSGGPWKDRSGYGLVSAILVGQVSLLVEVDCNSSKPGWCQQARKGMGGLCFAAFPPRTQKMLDMGRHRQAGFLGKGKDGIDSLIFSSIEVKHRNVWLWRLLCLAICPVSCWPCNPSGCVKGLLNLQRSGRLSPLPAHYANLIGRVAHHRWLWQWNLAGLFQYTTACSI